MKRIFVLLLVGVVVGLIVVGELQAVTVQFDTANRGPSDSLDIGGVTVSAEPTGQPATVLGQGLGNDLIGPNYSVDRIQAYQAGSLSPSEIEREGLTLSWAGTVSSLDITIVPYFSVSGPGEPVFLPFDIHLAFGPDNYVMPSGPDPITIRYDNIPSMFAFNSGSIDMMADFGNNDHFFPYLISQGYPAITFQFGFTITSLDYTLMSVPEPGSLLMLSLGVLGLSGFGIITRKRHIQGRA